MTKILWSVFALVCLAAAVCLRERAQKRRRQSVEDSLSRKDIDAAEREVNHLRLSLGKPENGYMSKCQCGDCVVLREANRNVPEGKVWVLK